MKQQRHNTMAAATTQERKLILSMTILISSFLFASWYASYDDFMRNCTKSNNSASYCESIYRG